MQRLSHEPGRSAAMTFRYDSHSIAGLGHTDHRGIGFCHNSMTFNPSTGPNPHRHKESAMASELIKHLSDASFEADVLQAGTPVLVDYWAEWCGPCKMIAPILDEVAATYQGKLQITKMNVDENREIPAKFGIRGIPTLMIFKDGQLAATKVGAMGKAQLTAFIDQQLA
jgi:thioredoxin 1